MTDAARRGVRLSVCVPALNEEKTLADTVADLRTGLAPFVSRLEIIIVNDGSTDATPALAEGIAREHPDTKVIHHRHKAGVGVCYRDGLACASGDYYTWFPADHENSAAELAGCVLHCLPDAVVTSHHKGADPRIFRRKVVSRIYTVLINTLFGLRITYYNGLSIYPVPVLKSFSLVADGFVFQAEAMVRAVKSGCRLIELQAPLKERAWGRSKAFTLSSFMRATHDAWHIALHQIRRR